MRSRQYSGNPPVDSFGTISATIGLTKRLIRYGKLLEFRLQYERRWKLLPNMRSSLASRIPARWASLTARHPPTERINPLPPVNSWRHSLADQLRTWTVGFRLASESLPPKNSQYVICILPRLPFFANQATMTRKAPEASTRALRGLF